MVFLPPCQNAGLLLLPVLTRLFSKTSTGPLILSEHFGLRRRFDFLIFGERPG